MKQTVRWLKIVVGFVLLPLGVIMLALPGPGWLTITLALAILAGEFVWARKLLDRMKHTAKKLDPRKKEPARLLSRVLTDARALRRARRDRPEARDQSARPR